MTVDLQALREKAQAATPGPWKAGSTAGRQQIWARRPGYAGKYCLFDDAFSYAGTDDAAFIASADPQTVLHLVEAVAQARHLYWGWMVGAEASEMESDWNALAAALAVFTDEATT